MPSVFTPILGGAPDPRVVWRDSRCVAMHCLEPLRAGHVVIVPREEIDHWIDLPADALAHVMEVARIIGGAVQAVFRPSKVAVMVLGLQVRHAHVHLIPVRAKSELLEPDAGTVDGVEAAARLRQELRARGCGDVAEG